MATWKGQRRRGFARQGCFVPICASLSPTSFLLRQQDYSGCDKQFTMFLWRRHFSHCWERNHFCAITDCCSASVCGPLSARSFQRAQWSPKWVWAQSIRFLCILIVHLFGLVVWFILAARPHGAHSSRTEQTDKWEYFLAMAGFLRSLPKKFPMPSTIAVVCVKCRVAKGGYITRNVWSLPVN